jgi:aldehyde dehydrogenase
MERTMQDQFKFDTEYNNYIGGQFVPAKSGLVIESINPSNKQVLATIPRSGAEDVNAAVSAAKIASKGEWLDTTYTERAEYLFKIQQAILDNADRLAMLEALDNGKPLSETTGADIPLCAKHFSYFAAVGLTHQDTHIDLPGQNSKNTAEPLGVVAMITPWNFPLLMFSWKIAPALITGNTIVIKPAEQTSLSALELMKIINGILPAGVLNVVTGLGSEAGAALATNKDIRKLAFTGSTVTGNIVTVEAAKNNIPCTTELGGKSPVFVFEDANLDEAAAGIVSAFTFNQGEVCTAGTRAFIQESIRDEMLELILEKAKAIKVGNPLDPQNTMGAIVSEAQFNKVQSYINYAAEDQNMEILCGPSEEVSSEGYFIRPTVVLTDNKSKLSTEEIFGPVLSLMTFKGEDDAIEMANDSLYSLGAGLWTNDFARVERMTGKRGICAGRIWHNQHHTYDAHSPFGGHTPGSGNGRETHMMMCAPYTKNKNVCSKR